MIPSARQDDLHVCPLPGHGSTPILSASSNVLINSMGSVRVGDVCACGAVIVVGFPTVRANGRPMAHLGSLSSHGGAIVTASQDVGGGFGGGAGPVIDFSRLGIIRPDGTFDEQRLTSLLADPDLVSKAKAADALIDPYSPSKSPPRAPDQPVCDHPDRMDELASYIADEMNRNIHDPTVREIKELLSFDIAQEKEKWTELPWYARLGSKDNSNNPEAIGQAKMTAALTLWTEKVGQDRPWDHKPKLRGLFGIWHKQGAYEYYYDIWSNIHYGYIGRAAGFNEGLLLDGAGVEQIASETFRFLLNPSKYDAPGPSKNIEGLRAWDDDPDRISISIGIALYELYPIGKLTGRIILEKVLAVGISNWKCGVQVHECYGEKTASCR